MPAIGARRTAMDSSTEPDLHHVCSSADVSCVYFDADGFSDEIDREHQTGVRALADESADDSLQRRRGPLRPSSLRESSDRGRRRSRSRPASGCFRSPVRESGPASSNDTMFTTPVHFRMAAHPQDRSCEAVSGKSGQSIFFLRFFQRLQRVIVGRKASSCWRSICSRTTCS